jgi:hypothetical protein
LAADLYEHYRDREWKEDFERYQFTDEQFLALHETTEFTQEYSYKNSDEANYLTYYQREWRLTFNSFPFAGGNKPHEPGTSCFYHRNGRSYQIFKFSPNDVEYLIVPLRYFLRARKLAKKLPCKVKIYEFSVGT